MTGKGKNALMAVIIAVLLLAVVGMGIYILKTPKVQPVEPEEPKQRAYLVTEENVEDVIEEIAETPRDATSYTATMNSDWHFPDGKSPSDNAYVGNASDNNWPVWFNVVLDSGETVYESPILPVGSHIENFSLDTPLKAGTYGAVITYHLVDENQTELSTLSIHISIQVDN